MNYVILALVFALFVFGLIKKYPLYDWFIEGARGAIPLAVSLFPYIACICIMVEAMTASGLSAIISKWLSPAFRFLGIPDGIFELVLFRPFSASGSIAILENVFSSFGADSYEARCAAVIAGSSETVFYVAAVYFASQGVKKLRGAIAISLVCAFFGVLLSCLLCRVL